MAVRTEDAQLVTAALAGDQSAFAELVSRYRDAVCGMAYHYLSTFEDAQDAAQEAFVRAYLHLRELRDLAKFGPWLRRITATVCADSLRRRGDRLVSLEAAEERAALPAASSPDEDVERVAARVVVREALGRLSDKTRLTVTLFYIDGYSHGEIADFLEVPVNTVRSRLQRAKRELREEMITMVSDVLNEGKPDPEFTRQVVEEAMRRGDEAHMAHATGDALAHYEEALRVVEELPASAEQQRLKMDLLWKQSKASHFPRGLEGAVKLEEQALSIAEELGDRERQASMMAGIGTSYANLGQKDKSEEYYRKALAAYRELQDAKGQGDCLFWLGCRRLEVGEVAAGQDYYRQALPFLEAANCWEMIGPCRGALDLLAEVGHERFPALVTYGFCCDGLRTEAGAVTYAFQPGYGRHEHGPEMPPALSVGSVFWQLSHLRKFLDRSVPVGGGWSGDVFSYSYQPLRGEITVKSDSERITIPAGSFGGCLLTEQVTSESDPRDDAPEHQKSLNRMFRCGTRRAWYAPGVGLVQLHVQPAEGAEAMIQLQEFSVPGDSSDYLPLAVGNAWTYGWPAAPPEWVAKEAYRVIANEGDTWYLEHYAYTYRE